MIIGIDIDNTLVNTAESVVDYINKRLPIKLDINNINQYWIENSLPEQYRWIVKTAFTDSSMWKNVRMIPDSAKFVEKLYNDGNDIYFVTSSLPENTKKKINHLSRNLPFLTREFIQNHTININNKQLLSLDILIDDCLDNLVGKRSYVSICLAYPWNNHEGENNFYRVGSWKEIYETYVYIKEVLYCDGD